MVWQRNFLSIFFLYGYLSYSIFLFSLILNNSGSQTPLEDDHQHFAKNMDVVFISESTVSTKVKTNDEIKTNDKMRSSLMKQLDTMDPACFKIDENIKVWRTSRFNFINSKTYGYFFLQNGELIALLPDWKSLLPGDHPILWGHKFAREIEKIGKNNELPSLDFLLSANDAIFSYNNIGQSIIFTANKKIEDNRKNIFLIPAFAFNSLRNYKKRYEECVTTREKLESKGFSFSKKKTQVFWRGSHMQPKGFDGLHKTSHARARTVILSTLYPHHLDCKFVNLPKNDASDTYNTMLHAIGGVGSYASLSDQMQYAYHLCLDGWAGSWELGGRLTEDMLLGNLCFNASEYEMYYECALEPFVHYIPVKSDLSNLLQQVEWAKSNPDKAGQIAENGWIFAQQYLNPSSVVDYLVFMFREIAKKQQYNENVSKFPRLNYSSGIPIWKEPYPELDSNINNTIRSRFNLYSKILEIHSLSKNIINTIVGENLFFGLLQNNYDIGTMKFTHDIDFNEEGDTNCISSLDHLHKLDQWDRWLAEDDTLFIMRHIIDNSNTFSFVFNQYMSFDEKGDTKTIIFGYNPHNMADSFPYLYFFKKIEGYFNA